ncbi:NosR/NirI family protein [Marimonas arenosa]|uniref:NosR/NirI family protein n=1 Tax=Marimonas arenosa TaxID=1795305 RepID=A0AAE3WFV1_9RHOB|nr:NosR/NirI family protein [Marimonas arenosa]MDQ2091778.1 NosR/NirI family protein [Marimonas arenosa]
MRILLATLMLIAGLWTLATPVPVFAQHGAPVDFKAPIAPDQNVAAELMGVQTPVVVTRQDDGVPGWEIAKDGTVLGYIGSTWEIANSVGYSGRPLEVLVGIDTKGKISAARLVRHNEPILTLGISDADIAAYVDGFAGYDLTQVSSGKQTALPDVISRATVSTGVIRDGILRTARTLAAGRGVIAAKAGIDRLSYEPLDWPALLAAGALAEAHTSMTDASAAFAGAKVPVPPGEDDFLRFWAGLVDTPTVGQNLLGQQEFTRAIGNLGPDETSLIVIGRGLYSHRGTAWRRSGTFDRIVVLQDDLRWHPTADSYHMVKRLLVDGAPEVKEISLFRLPSTFDPLDPLRIEITATRPSENDTRSMTIGTDYRLPEAFRTAPPPEERPLWQVNWMQKQIQVGIVATMLAVLWLIFFAQEWIVRRPRLWRGVRLTFLTITLFVLGWGLNAQLSVVQVVAFIHSLLSGFRWETFLIEPLIFLLWGFVALGLLFWGRGVYCGWLCPFGALQELLNALAVRLGIKQIAVPRALHERFWVLKYTAFVAILALSFYSMRDALIVAEVEPFKTAISLRMMRAWPFVLFVLALLAASLFIERFYCRYLCPLGAGLAIPAKLKIFDWLHRRPQCGRECRMCETRCTVGAIDEVGRINPNECVLCLRCQVIMLDPTQCNVLKRRARGAAPSSGDAT